MVLSFLFQLLKYVPAFWGLSSFPLFLPCGCFLHLHWQKQRGHQFNVGFWWALIAGSVALTGMAISEDQANLKHGAAIEEANWQADRVIEIADSKGFLPAGAVTLLRQDPKSGPPSFRLPLCKLSQV
ncbi:MAG: hypothetical protein CM15mP130_2480 [Verrucomicrobiota bacterium]|nr:MAG: hypothetical protein CM15mP130_2480 [Verrucomicrobiota bacterium]